MSKYLVEEDFNALSMGELDWMSTHLPGKKSMSVRIIVPHPKNHGKFLLVFNSEKGVGNGETRREGWGHAGGGVRKNEKPCEAAARELFTEETLLKRTDVKIPRIASYGKRKKNSRAGFGEHIDLVFVAEMEQSGELEDGPIEDYAADGVTESRWVHYKAIEETPDGKFFLTIKKNGKPWKAEVYASHIGFLRKLELI
ncbi:MAG: NUDIX hydrolase [Candidatus Jorgensenbacteria bacterium]|nr:NUDIX hydrolase [Candidatus Jorgensenbacteria bacterium]